MKRITGLWRRSGLIACLLFAAHSAPSLAGGVRCPATLAVGKSYECRLPSTGPSMRFELVHAPDGMAVQARSGVLRWSPMVHQAGGYDVTVRRLRDGVVHDETNLHFEVKGSAVAMAAPRGIYVSTTGKDTAAGTFDQPYLTIDKAAKVALPGDTIYLRGGVYRNAGFGTSYVPPRTRGNLSRIITSGSATAPITLTAYLTELVTLQSDVNALVFQGAKYWNIRNLEIAGNAQTVGAANALATWWKPAETVQDTTGAGIYLGDSYNIEISDCVIHDFPGPGVVNNHSAYIALLRNVIYNNAWWSTNGVHGFTNSKPKSLDQTNTTAIKVTMSENLVYGNQSSMISHDYASGFQVLDIDEGNGLHMQNTEKGFVGKFLVENNLIAFNGKGGLGMNTIKGGIVRNNSFYHNAQAVDTGELVLQTSTADTVEHNLFHAMPARRTINDLSKLFTNVGENYAVPAADDGKLPASVHSVPAVFLAPELGVFLPSLSVPLGNGVADTTLTAMTLKMTLFGLTPKPAPTVIDANYLRNLKSLIISTWPTPVATDTIPDNLVFKDPETGFCYDYAHRGAYPGPSGVTCPH